MPDTRTAVEPPARAERLRRARRWLLELGVVGLGYTLLSQWQTNDLLSDGSSAPDFEVDDVTGERVRLSDYADKLVILHFWATWCGVCRREFDMLNQLERTLGGERTNTLAAPKAVSKREVVLLALVAEAERDQLLPFLQQHGIAYPVLLAPHQLMQRYRVSAFPTTYYLESGIVRAATVGMSSGWAMRTRLACT